MSVANVESSAVLDRENSSPFREMLEGSKAFYNQSDYLETTRRDFAHAIPLPVVHYIWNTESKVKKIAAGKLVFIAAMVVGVTGLLVLSKCTRILVALCIGLMLAPLIVLGVFRKAARALRAQIPLKGEWKYKRITIEVGGNKIDAVMVGRASTLNNGRWVLTTDYENKLISNRSFIQLLSEVQGNAVIFNYPGFGASSGSPNAESAAKAYRAMLAFLEDQKRGIGAQEIIGYNYHDFMQADALKTHELKKDVKYVFIQNRNFSYWNLVLNPTLNKLRKYFMPTVDPADFSKQLQAPEIILQAAHVENYEELKESSKIRGDGRLPAKAALAKALLDDDQCPKDNKVFIGVPYQTEVELQNPTFLAQKINELLKKQGTINVKK